MGGKTATRRDRRTRDARVVERGNAPWTPRSPRGRSAAAWPPARTGSRAWRRSCEAWSSATVIVMKLSLAPGGLFYSSTRPRRLGSWGIDRRGPRRSMARRGRARRTRESPENLHHDVFITKALRAKAAIHAADVSLEYTSRARGRDDRCLLRSSPSPVRPESASVSNPKIALGWDPRARPRPRALAPPSALASAARGPSQSRPRRSIARRARRHRTLSGAARPGSRTRTS